MVLFYKKIFVDSILIIDLYITLGRDPDPVNLSLGKSAIECRYVCFMKLWINLYQFYFKYFCDKSIFLI